MPRARFLDQLRRLASDEAGVTAAEFALVLPGVAMLTVGTAYLGLMMFASNNLHYAAEDAARCASVNPTVCTSATTTQTYAAGRYKGAGTPTFTATSPACGKQVAASLTYSLNTGLATISVPISATACYPLP
jgi:Flp pilus assembly protein TadG